MFLTVQLADGAVEKNWLGAKARRGKAELSSAGSFYLLYLHISEGLGKTEGREGMSQNLNWHHRSGGKTQRPPETIKGCRGEFPQRSEIFTLF